MSEMPDLRDAPPWAMEEMILSEPGLVGPILASGEVAEAAALVRTADEPLLITGCGTSEHAAMAGAALLGGGARDAFEASLEPQQSGVLIGVSHEGETAATLAALQAADAAKVLITAKPETAKGVDLVIPTPQHDKSWCQIGRAHV